MQLVMGMAPRWGCPQRREVGHPQPGMRRRVRGARRRLRRGGDVPLQVAATGGTGGRTRSPGWGWGARRRPADRVLQATLLEGDQETKYRAGGMRTGEASLEGRRRPGRRGRAGGGPRGGAAGGAGEGSSRQGWRSAGAHLLPEEPEAGTEILTRDFGALPAGHRAEHTERETQSPRVRPPAADSNTDGWRARPISSRPRAGRTGRRRPMGGRAGGCASGSRDTLGAAGAGSPRGPRLADRAKGKSLLADWRWLQGPPSAGGLGLCCGRYWVARKGWGLRAARPGLSFPSCKMGPGAAPPSRRVVRRSQTLGGPAGRFINYACVRGGGLHFPECSAGSASPRAPGVGRGGTPFPRAPRGRQLPSSTAPGAHPPAPTGPDAWACSPRRGRRPCPDGLVVSAAARWTVPRSPSRWPTWCSPCASCSRPPSSTWPGSRCRTCCRAGWAARTLPSCPITCAARLPRCCATRCCRWVRRPILLDSVPLVGGGSRPGQELV